MIRTRVYLVDAADAQAVSKAHKEILGEARPAATMVGVSGFLDPACSVEVEVEAVVCSGARVRALSPPPTAGAAQS